ncbi:MAG: TVP38/TMEM64 family protein [Nitrospirae bacterium]|nr:TVP38/TMEM64 family protein [Nitrospirota bacterium]
MYTHPDRRNPKIWIAAAVTAAAVLFVTAALPHVRGLLRDALAWVSGLGAAGPFIFIAVYIAACILLVPGSILTLGAGFIFGVVKGTLIASAAATLGAACAFLVGRYVARGWVEKRVEGDARFKAVDDAVAREGWKIVFLTRLSPVFPFVILNYVYGLTRVSFRDYFLASWAGMLPGTLMYVYIGSLAGDLALVGADGRGRTPLEWAFYIAGLAATVAVTVYVTRIARAALKAKADV